MRPLKLYLTGEKYWTHSTNSYGALCLIEFKFIINPPSKVKGKLMIGAKATAAVSELKADDKK